MRNLFLVVGFTLATVAVAIVATDLSVNLRVATLHSPTDSGWVGWDDDGWLSRWDDQDWNDPRWENDQV